MIHMTGDGVQYCSSFTTSAQGLRHIPMNTGKRARSPEDYENGGARPSKRPSLAIGEFNRRHQSHSSANSSRQGSEDWVHAAGGLTIDSPIYISGDPSNPFITRDSVSDGGSVGVVEDVDMAMESEESQELSPRRPQLEPLRTSFNAHQHEQSHPHPLSVETNTVSQQSTPRRHAYGTRYAEKVHGAPIPPHINVVPATPVNHLSTSQPQFYDNQHVESRMAYNLTQTLPVPASSSFSPVPMAVSPQTSYAQLASPTKRRVVFGPRANCEKCRLGVQGHFAHYE